MPAGRLVRDLVRHLVIDAQDVLITLATPAGTEPTRDAVTYRPECTDRRGEGRTGRTGRETPVRPRMTVRLNGTFGAGRTTARELVTRL